MDEGKLARTGRPEFRNHSSRSSSSDEEVKSFVIHPQFLDGYRHRSLTYWRSTSKRYILTRLWNTENQTHDSIRPTTWNHVILQPGRKPKDRLVSKTRVQSLTPDHLNSLEAVLQKNILWPNIGYGCSDYILIALSSGNLLILPRRIYRTCESVCSLGSSYWKTFKFGCSWSPDYQTTNRRVCFSEFREVYRRMKRPARSYNHWWTLEARRPPHNCRSWRNSKVCSTSIFNQRKQTETK